MPWGAPRGREWVRGQASRRRGPVSSPARTVRADRADDLLVPRETCRRRPRGVSGRAPPGPTVMGMRYRKLGSSDLEVSEISLGSWLTFSGGVALDQTRACTD